MTSVIIANDINSTAVFVAQASLHNAARACRRRTSPGGLIFLVFGRNGNLKIESLQFRRMQNTRTISALSWSADGRPLGGVEASSTTLISGFRTGNGT